MIANAQGHYKNANLREQIIVLCASREKMVDFDNKCGMKFLVARLGSEREDLQAKGRVREKMD